ncbi:MAG: MerR family transcriptional regulator [Candidatus Limnocylindria bacterium]
MRISDLSRESGVSIPTIKFYLREGVLPAGRRTAPNQATYDGSHLRRLHLVRVLIEVGGMRLAAVRRVLEALDDSEQPLTQVLGVAHRALDRPSTSSDPAVESARREVDGWLDDRGWEVTSDAPARSTLASTLVALRQLGWEVGPNVFDRYADHVDEIARDELAYVAGSASREAAVEATVIGTVVFERAISALRRLAQEHHSRRRLGS